MHVEAPGVVGFVVVPARWNATTPAMTVASPITAATTAHIRRQANETLSAGVNFATSHIAAEKPINTRTGGTLNSSDALIGIYFRAGVKRDGIAGIL